MASNPPFVSVIMNCFNGAEFLHEALASVIAQSYANWELIFWDNRSTDGSADIARSIDDPRIRYFLATEHTSLSAARNRAIEQARGEWIGFLDCDDVWLPGKLSLQVARIAEDDRQDHDTPLGLVYGRSLILRPDGSESELIQRFAGKPLPEGQLLQRLLVEGVFVAAPTVMLRRSALDAVGGVNEAYLSAFDYYFLVAICEHYRAVAVQDMVAKYRVHQNNLTLSFAEELHREPLAILEKWGHHMPPEQLDRRRREYHTLLSVDLLLRGRVWRATRELLQNGSVAYLAGRFVARLTQGRFLAR